MKSIISLLNVITLLIICCFGNVESSDYMYATTTTFISNIQTFSKIEISTNTVIFNHTFTNLHYVIVSVLSINETNIEFLGYDLTTADNLLIGYKYDSNGTNFKQVEEFISIQPHSMLFEMTPLPNLNHVVTVPSVNFSSLIVLQWDFNNHQLNNIDTSIQNADPNQEVLYNAFDKPNNLLYISVILDEGSDNSGSASSEQITTTNIAIFDLTNNEIVKEIKGIQSLDPESIQLLFVDNNGELYAASNQSSTNVNTVVSFCKFNFDSLTCDHIVDDTCDGLLNLSTDINLFYPIVQSFDGESIMVITNSTLNSKSVIQIDKFDISTWTKTTSIIDNYWTTGINSNFLNF